jgi:hypothetical protein
VLVRLIEDLRFVIGAFFAVISVILIITGLITPTMAEGTTVNLNLTVGCLMALFAVFMITLAYLGMKAGREL